MKIEKLLILTASMLLLVACGSEYEYDAYTECTSTATDHYLVCGFKNPEDFVYLPPELLIVSEMADFFDPTDTGRLSVLNIETGVKQQLELVLSTQVWGDPLCSKPDFSKFSPHGIDIALKDGTQLQLAVVNHGEREAIELFAIVRNSETGQLQARWQGCVASWEDPFYNDVVIYPNGTIIATHMWNREDTAGLQLMAKIMFGMDTGYVEKWVPDLGYSRLQSSHGTMPNGITKIDSLSDRVFINYYFEDKVKAIDVTTGDVYAEAEIRQPDNITTYRNKLYVASHDNHYAAPMNNCSSEQRKSGPCMLPFTIYELDPLTLESKPIFSHLGGPPFGTATTAVLLNDTSMVMGSFLGDRLMFQKIPNVTQ